MVFIPPTINYHIKLMVYLHMVVAQKIGIGSMDRSTMIHTYEAFWITCVLVWIGGMDRLWVLPLDPDLQFWAAAVDPN